MTKLAMTTRSTSRDAVAIEYLLFSAAFIAPAALLSLQGSRALPVAITFLVCGLLSGLTVRALVTNEREARRHGQAHSTLHLHGLAAVMPRLLMQTILLPFRLLGLCFAFMGVMFAVAARVALALRRRRS